jgi:hypothetical protein
MINTELQGSCERILEDPIECLQVRDNEFFIAGREMAQSTSWPMLGRGEEMI